MRFVFVLLCLCLLPAAPLFAQEKLGDRYVCRPMGHSKFYDRYANLPWNSSNEAFSSALSVFFSIKDPRVHNMISDLGLRSRPSGFKLLIEHIPLDADEVKRRATERLENIVSSSSVFEEYSIYWEKGRVIYQTSTPHDTRFVFKHNALVESTSDKQPAIDRFISECHHFERPNSSYCHLEQFIDDSLRLKVRFPAEDYASGQRIFRYMQRYVETAILRDSESQCFRAN